MPESEHSNATVVIATFEFTPRPGVSLDEALALQQKLLEMARANPDIGEIELSSWAGADGTMMALYTFKSMEALQKFVRHPEHVAAMRRGAEFFTSTRTRIASVERFVESTFGS